MKADNTHKMELIEKAREQYKDQRIVPCGGKNTLEECFTYCGKILIFWFNTSEDDSTRMIHMDTA